MIKCIAIDDEPLAVRQMASYIEKTPFLDLVATFTSALKAMDFILSNQVDLMFVDINMPDLSGVDFVKSLTKPPKVIFTTAYREYALEGFQLDAADYLVKPIAYSDFLHSASKTKERYFNSQTQSTANDNSYLFIKAQHRTLRINYDEILYVESQSDYVRLHLEDRKPIMALMSLRKISEHLPHDIFMRVHRSFIVNLSKITTIERNRIVFWKDTYIPVSDQYKEEFQTFIDSKFLK